MSQDRTRVMYVAGSGHTGSTLLALLLDGHPEIACTGETAIKPKIRQRRRESTHRCSCGALVSECPFWMEVFTLVRGRGYELDSTRWTNDYRFEQPLAQRVLNRLCASAPGRDFVRWGAGHLPVYRERVARIDAVNVAFIRAVLQVSGAAVFADTSKRLPRLVHLSRIPELDVSVVLLARDVRGYAASAKRRGVTVSDAARTWNRDQEAMAEIARDLPAGRVHRIRYEDLCEDPASTLGGLWRFCGVSDVNPPDLVDASHHHVLGNSMRMAGTIRIRLDQSWKKRLDPREADAVLAIAGDANRRLGYV